MDPAFSSGQVGVQFCMWLANNTEPISPTPAYTQLLLFYDVPSLQARRHHSDIMFYSIFLYGYY